MKWLRRLIYRRVVKGFEFRLKSLEDLMESAQSHMSKLYDQLEKLETESPRPAQTITKLTDERETWSRIYWDAYNRHEEVETGLMFVLKDFNRR